MALLWINGFNLSINMSYIWFNKSLLWGNKFPV